MIFFTTPNGSGESTIKELVKEQTQQSEQSSKKNLR